MQSYEDYPPISTDFQIYKGIKIEEQYCEIMKIIGNKEILGFTY